jgi:hypothetical protein
MRSAVRMPVARPLSSYAAFRSVLEFALRITARSA